MDVPAKKRNLPVKRKGVGSLAKRRLSLVKKPRLNSVNRPRPASVKKRQKLAIGLLLINVVCWGAVLPVAKLAVDLTSPFHFLLFRFSFAALLSWPILWWYWRKLKPSWKLVSNIVLLELIGTFLALASLFAGLALTSALEASFLTTTTPIFITLGGIWFLHERQEGYEWLGLALALAGTLLITFEPLISSALELAWTGMVEPVLALTRTGMAEAGSGLGGGSVGGGSVDGAGLGAESLATSVISTELEPAEFSLIGNLLILVYNILTAGYFLLAKKYYKNVPKLFVTPISFFVGAVAFFLLGWWQFGDFSWLSLVGLVGFVDQLQLDLAQPMILWPSVIIAVFGSIIGLTVYIAAQDLIEASEASLFSYLQPLVYIPLSMWLLGEVLKPILVVAVTIIAVGVYLGSKFSSIRR